MVGYWNGASIECKYLCDLAISLKGIEELEAGTGEPGGI